MKASSILVLAALVAPLYPTASRADDVADGKTAFSSCSGCHAIDGSNRLGPPLNGLIGRKAGSVPGFNYSAAMKHSSIVWDKGTVGEYLANPQEKVPGNRMPFAGLQDPKKRDDIAAYLATLH